MNITLFKIVSIWKSSCMMCKSTSLQVKHSLLLCHIDINLRS